MSGFRAITGFMPSPRLSSWSSLVLGLAGVACSSPSSPVNRYRDAAESTTEFVCPKGTPAIQTKILVPKCAEAGCHDLNTQISGLDLASPDLDRRLINVAALGCFGDSLLVPGNPDASLMFTKIAQAKPECGLRMPYRALALAPAEIDCVRQWILDLSNGGGSDAGVTGNGGEGNRFDGGATEPLMSCSPGQTSCGGTCVDKSKDNLNCGGCGRICGGGSTCSMGQCVCPSPTVLCGATCVLVASNNANCGICGKVCGVGSSCQSGACKCLDGLLDCNGSCVDTKTNFDNCGSCGKQCSTGQICNGICSRGACPRDTKNCGGSCVDTSADETNCGACSVKCAAGQTCTAGQCGCGVGTTLCGGQCVTTDSDSNNCGGCGKVCPAGSSCLAGQCGCGGLTACGATCTDTASDSSNCGSCSKLCAPGESCSNGMCTSVCAPGTDKCGGDVCLSLQSDPKNCGACGKLCAVGEQCRSGLCVGCGAPVSFAATIQPIFTASCTTGCHGGSRPSAGLDLSPGNAYAALVGKLTSGCRDNRVRVAAGNPSGSYLLDKLLGQNMCSGSQMPARGTSLPPAQIEAVRSWICQGAPAN